MSKTIHVTFDPDAIALHIEQPDEAILTGEMVAWIFHGVPENFSPLIIFKSIVREDANDGRRYYGPFMAFTQEIPGEDRDQTRFWGMVMDPEPGEYTYRAMIQTGVGEDPFDEPYGNSPESVGKAVIVSTEGVLRKESRQLSLDRPAEERRQILEIAEGNKPLALITGETKLIPITQREVDGTTELCIHDDFLFVRRVDHDTVVWDFTAIPHSINWFPIVDFIGGDGMAYSDVKNMHFGPFSSITYTAGRVIGTGLGKVRGAYHYRVAMMNLSTNKMDFKSSPDPVVDYPDPTGDGGGN